MEWHLQKLVVIWLQLLIALAEVNKEMFKENPDFYPIKPLDYGRFLVISIGTGTQKNDHKYNARRAAKWGLFGWLYNKGSAPLISVFSDASSDMVDYHLSVVFQVLRSQENYLRIQVSLIFHAPVDSICAHTRN